MLKKILVLIVFSFSMEANEYIFSINKSNYNKSISIQSYVKKELKCNLPEVLNETKTSCEIIIPTCVDPEILNQEQNKCINPIEAVGWIYTNGDTCNGMRKSNFNSNIYFARSRSTAGNTSLEIPQGYSWLTYSEYVTLFVNSTVVSKSNFVRKYYKQCGLSGYPEIDGVAQTIFYLKGESFAGFSSGSHEHEYSKFVSTIGLAGYILYKN